MPSVYVKHAATKNVPQTQPMSNMIANNGGGFGFEVDKWTQLQRFLILGSEGGTYYVKEQKLTEDNCKNVIACIKADGARTVGLIVSISEAGRAPKNDPAIFALALCTAHGDAKTKALAYASIKRVCRIGTHIFQFCEAVQALRGWSRGMRNGVAGFYLAKKSDDAIYQFIKYRQRNGWTHKDVLRLSHPHAPTIELGNAFKWAVGKNVPQHELPERILAFNVLQDESLKADVLAEVIRKHRMPWEAIPTTRHKDPAIWEALLPDMGLTALIRNLGRLSAIGLLKSNLDPLSKVIADRITDADALRKSRVHPMAILSALKTYEQGHGEKGSLSWTPVRRVVDALDAAFTLAFKNVEPTGKNLLLAIDVSGSMTGNAIAGSSLDARTAAAAMALVTARTEPNTELIAFSNGIIPFKVSANATLSGLVAETARLPFSGTDCAAPMLWALTRKISVDAFCIYTDSETNSNSIHPKLAMDKYRKATGIRSKLVVVGMCATNVSIADPADAGMLDVVGFDTATPNVISEFAAR